jgi:PAS domain S-box-containing protein
MLLFAALLVLGSALSAWRWSERQATDRVQRERLQSQAQRLGQHLELLLTSVNRVMQLADAAPQTPYGPDAADAAAHRLHMLNEASVVVRGLQILDATGRVQIASNERLDTNDVARQPCFAQARQRHDDGTLYTCTAYKGADGRWSVSLLQARRTADGDFAGVVAATLDVDYLIATLPSALYAPDMRAFLMHSNGIVVASSQAEAYSTGTDIAKSPLALLNRYRALGRQEAVIEGPSTVGGNRIVAFRYLNPKGLTIDAPLLIAVSRSVPAAYADWTLATVLCAAAWLFVACAGAAALARTQRLRRRLTDEVSVLRQERVAELERVELIVDAAGLSLWVWHVVDRCVEIDARWCAMVGRPADELTISGRGWLQQVHPDDTGRLREVMQLRPGDGVRQVEYRLRHDDGHWVWVLARGKVVAADARGRPVRIAGTNIDITERKQVERALRSSEESLSTTLQSIGDAVIATDAQGLVTRLNPTAEALTGWPAAAAIGRPLAEVFRILNGQTRESAADPVQLVLAQGVTVGLANNTLLVARDGRERQIADSAAPIRDLAGTITGAVLVFSDVTEAYRVQQALRDSESQLRLITDTVPALVARYDLQRRFLFANRAHERWSGLPVSHLIGRSLSEVYGDDLIGSREAFIRRVEAGESVSFESLRDSPTLGRRLLLVTLAPEFDSDGTVRGHISVVTDITDRHVLEEHLRESQKMDSIGTLAGGIAHDFNNVLGAIIGNVEIALQELDAAHAARVNLEQISRASQRARSLVQKILTFSRNEPQQLVTQALQPLIDETLDLLRTTLPARVELLTEVTQSPLYVNADAIQIQQLLMNLGTNAWHALDAGTGRIVVGLKELNLGEGDSNPVAGMPAGRYAYLWVSDTGVGMDAATRQRIFEPFFTTKPVGRGTGLGLSVVHGIVKTHLGGIAVDTAPNRGTTFHVLLPATQRPSQVGTLDEAEARAMRGRGQHVMYVDDDEVMALMVEQLLQRSGYRVTICRDAKQGLSAFAENPRAFDLVVTDFNMPDFSGLELAAELARIRPELPVAISSGYVSEELRAGARRVGVRYLMQKQNTFEELAALVHRALADVEAARAAEV